MTQNIVKLSQRYLMALRKHLKQGTRATLQPALKVGNQAVALGLETSDLIEIHQRALATLDVSSARNGPMKRAEFFLNEAITPIEQTHAAGVETRTSLSRTNKSLGRCTVDLTASNQSLKQGISRHKTAEVLLRKDGRHYTKLLRESNNLEKHLRHLTHRVLSAQEMDRKNISRELDDEIAQTLLGINVRLLTVKDAAKGNTANLKKVIANMQRLVEKSVRSINRFALELDLRQQVPSDRSLLQALLAGT